MPQTSSVREKSKLEPLKLETLKPYDPPVITTTAATPQDSPNATLGHESAFTNWDYSNADLDEMVTNHNHNHPAD